MIPQETIPRWGTYRTDKEEEEEKSTPRWKGRSATVPPLEKSQLPELSTGDKLRASPFAGPFGWPIKPVDPIGVGKRLVEQGKEMVEGIPQFAKSVSSLTLGGGIDQALQKGFQPRPDDEEPSEGKGVLKSALEPISALGVGAFEMGKWTVQSGFKLAKDPVGYIEENPLDAALELVGYGVVKGLKRLRGPQPKIGAKTIAVGAVDESVLRIPKELPSKARKRNAIAMAKDDPLKLRLFAEERGVPGAERGILKLKENGTLPISIDEFLSLADDTIPDMKAGKSFMGRAKNWTERMTTPMVWASKVHPLWEKLYEYWHIKDKAYLKDYSNIKKNVIGGWKKKLKADQLDIKASSDRIATYMIGEQKGGDDILRSMGRRKIYREQLKPIEWEIVSEARVAYDKFFERINRVRELAGKKPIKYVDNYFTFMRNIEMLGDMGMGLLDDATALNGVLSATPLKWANPRKGLGGPVKLDFFGVFERYSRDSIQHIHVSPVIARGKAFLEDFEIPSGTMKKDGTHGQTTWRFADDKPQTAQNMKEWLNAIGGKGDLSKIPDHAYLQRGAALLNRNIAAAVLSANVRSAMIQFTALRGAITEAGYLHTIKGSAQNLNKTKRAFAMQHSKVLFGRDMDIHVADIVNRTTKGKLSNLHRTAAEWGMKPLQFFDMETARASWLSVYDYYTTRKLGAKISHADAVKLADNTVLRTQASGKLGDVAKMQRGVGGRLISMFQTFTTAEWNWIMRDVVGIKNPEANLGRSMVRTLRFLTASMGVNMLFEDLLNMPSPFPAPEIAVREGIKEGKGAKEIAGGVTMELLEQLPVVGSPIKYSQKWRSNIPAPAVQLGADLIQVASKLAGLSPEKLTLYDLESFAKLAGIPGTSQARKTIARIRRGESIASAILGGRRRGKSSGSSGMDW